MTSIMHEDDLTNNFQPVNDLITQYMQLSRVKQQKFMEKALRDSAWIKSGAGVGDDLAEKNRASLQPDGGIISGDDLRREVKELFGVDDAALDRMVEIVEQVTDAKADRFTTALKDLLAQYGGYFTDNADDHIDALSARIDELETAIGMVERENDRLRWEIEQQCRAIDATKQQRNESKKTPKRSFIEEDMMTPDEDNSWLLEDDSNKNSRMQKFVERVERDSAFMTKGN